MRSPTQSTVWRVIACDKASKSNILSRQFLVWAEAARPTRPMAARTDETLKPPVTRNIVVLCPDLCSARFAAVWDRRQLCPASSLGRAILSRAQPELRLYLQAASGYRRDRR